jgi:hypothetical protein
MHVGGGGGPSGLAAQGGLDNFTTAQRNINASILEYLLKYGFMKTVDLFQEELSGQRGNM